MKFNIKSKLGFTLIELLVVIGILAVLAAIAIPSVAGLIDRANVSADSTNANEMTNAIERFTSEYELYLQDISSGRLDTTNLDSAQGRVYNVTGATDRAGIEALEKDATAGVDTTGRAIYRDTKYPVNAETMQAIVENYMKTSSATFTPKQSDCHFYYSPDCGLVVCTETIKSSVTDLNLLIQSGKDAKGKDLGSTTKWIDLTTSVSVDNTPVTPDEPNVPDEPNISDEPNVPDEPNNSEEPTPSNPETPVPETPNETVQTFNFSVDGITLTAEKGMTWGEWLESEYADSRIGGYLAGVDRVYIKYTFQSGSFTYVHISTTSAHAEKSTDTIVENNAYVLYASQGPYGDGHTSGSIF